MNEEKKKKHLDWIWGNDCTTLLVKLNKHYTWKCCCPRGTAVGVCSEKRAPWVTAAAGHEWDSVNSYLCSWGCGRSSWGSLEQDKVEKRRH